LLTNTKGFNVKLEEVSHNVAMLAVQGPEATNTLQELSNENLREIERFKCRHTEIADTAVFLSRTGYTGEDGFEIFVWNSPLTNSQNALNLWKSILETGKPYGIEPCGLGARDTLRLEAGLCLYGNDIDETTTPLEAGLGFVVKLRKESFIAKDVLQKQKTEGVKRKRVGILMTEQGIPRAKMDVLNEKGEKIGQLTSGTFSPLLKIGVGMAYIEVAQAQEGAGVSVRIRDKLVKAKIAPFPLYDPEKYGSKRKALSGSSPET
jgi:aminomethyltransferase